MPDRPAVVFDLDDTLIATSATFDAAKECFGALLAAHGFAPGESLRLLSEVDLRRVEAEGFGRTRFPASMRETYETLCERRGVPAEEPVARAAERIGADVYDTPPTAFPNAHEALRELVGAGCRLFLLTKGDPDVQHFRIDSASLRGYFDAVHVYPRKALAELRRVVEEHGLGRAETWVVGDSVRSDINPALEEGLLAILVGENRWQYEDVPPLSEAFYRAPEIGGVPPYVLANGNRPPLPDATGGRPATP